jgi:hypothetical protein
MRKAIVFAFITAAVIISGCTEIRLANGKYTCNLPGREDFAAVYNDQIFLRLRNAEDETMNNGYWDWAGKYKIVDGCHIELDMDRQKKRSWNFYYNLTMQGNAIVVEDLRAENSYVLKLRPAVYKRPAAMERHEPSPYPAYK